LDLVLEEQVFVVVLVALVVLELALLMLLGL
jgi:hypothetical protein